MSNVIGATIDCRAVERRRMPSERLRALSARAIRSESAGTGAVASAVGTLGQRPAAGASAASNAEPSTPPAMFGTADASAGAQKAGHASAGDAGSSHRATAARTGSETPPMPCGTLQASRCRASRASSALTLRRRTSCARRVGRRPQPADAVAASLPPARGLACGCTAAHTCCRSAKARWLASRASACPGSSAGPIASGGCECASGRLHTPALHNRRTPAPVHGPTWSETGDDAGGMPKGRAGKRREGGES